MFRQMKRNSELLIELEGISRDCSKHTKRLTSDMVKSCVVKSEIRA